MGKTLASVIWYVKSDSWQHVIDLYNRAALKTFDTSFSNHKVTHGPCQLHKCVTTAQLILCVIVEAEQKHACLVLEENIWWDGRHDALCAWILTAFLPDLSVILKIHIFFSVVYQIQKMDWKIKPHIRPVVIKWWSKVYMSIQQIISTKYLKK